MNTERVIRQYGLFSAALVALWMLLIPVAHSQTLNGVINVRITLTDSCTINGAAPFNGETVGILDYGTHPTLFTDASAQVQAPGSSPFTIQCSASTAPTLEVLNGSNDANAITPRLHAMSNGANKFVPYDLYTDAGNTSVISNGSVFFTSANNNTQETVLIYGKAYGTAGLVSGTYTDVVTITFTF